MNIWWSEMRIYNQQTLRVVLRYEWIYIYICIVCVYIYIYICIICVYIYILSLKLGVWACNRTFIYVIYIFGTNHIMKVIMDLSWNTGNLFSQYCSYTVHVFVSRICRHWGFPVSKHARYNLKWWRYLWPIGGYNQPIEWWDVMEI